MNRDVHVLTPPSQPALTHGLLQEQLSSKAKPKQLLFTRTNCRSDLVDQYPELVHVCDQIGFGDNITLGTWSESCELALLELARGAFPPPPALICDLSSADVSELVADLIEGHHYPLRNELQRIGILLEHWSAQYHSEAHARFLNRFREFSAHLIAHLDQEETVLFPQCLAIDRISRLPQRNAADFIAVTPAIRAMHEGHEQAEYSLQRLRAELEVLSRDNVDSDVALIRIGLSEIAKDFVVHATKESEFLLPAVIFAEDLARARHGLF